MATRLQYWINAVHQDEQAILDRLSKSTMTEQAAASKRAAQEKRRAEKRLTELDNLLAKIYEDRVNEKITERNFSMLSQIVSSICSAFFICNYYIIVHFS